MKKIIRDALPSDGDGADDLAYDLVRPVLDEVLGERDVNWETYQREPARGATANVTGYAVLLTNDSAYWAGRAETIDADFRLHDDRLLNGVYQWHEKAGIGTIRGRERPLTIVGQHPLTRRDYSRFDTAGFGWFRYLAVQVCEFPIA